MKRRSEKRRVGEHSVCKGRVAQLKRIESEWNQQCLKPNRPRSCADYSTFSAVHIFDDSKSTCLGIWGIPQELHNRPSTYLPFLRTSPDHDLVTLSL